VLLSATKVTNFLLEEDDPDNYGMVIGQLIDVETGKPVKEVFKVEFNLAEYKDNPVMFRQNFGPETDSNGRFMTKWEPGNYILYCYPVKPSDVYCYSPLPLYYQENAHEVRVERGKITRTVIKAYRGGKLRLMLVDPAGRITRPNDYIEGIQINWRLVNYIGGFSALDTGTYHIVGSLRNGEWTFTSIYPGDFYLELDFGPLGYGSRRIDHIRVEKGQTVETKVLVDMNDTTGVEGRVFDQNGVALKDVEVEISERKKGNADSFRIRAAFSTDSNGYYKIIGLKEGYYGITYDAFLRIETVFDTIYIKNGVILKKNIKVKNR
jgi:hypothetical protein